MLKKVLTQGVQDCHPENFKEFLQQFKIINKQVYHTHGFELGKLLTYDAPQMCI